MDSENWENVDSDSENGEDVVFQSAGVDMNAEKCKIGEIGKICKMQKWINTLKMKMMPKEIWTTSKITITLKQSTKKRQLKIQAWKSSQMKPKKVQKYLKYNNPFGTEVQGSDQEKTGITIVNGQSELNNHDRIESNILNLETSTTNGFRVKSGHYNI